MLTALHPLFDSPDWPELIQAEHFVWQNTEPTPETDRWLLQLQVAADLKWLEGHFPNQPVLPGVVQTHWACQLALHLFALQTHPRRIDNLKFQNVILPPQILQLELCHHVAKTLVTFVYLDPERPAHIFSEGKLVF